MGTYRGCGAGNLRPAGARRRLSRTGDLGELIDEAGKQKRTGLREGTGGRLAWQLGTQSQILLVLRTPYCRCIGGGYPGQAKKISRLSCLVLVAQGSIETCGYMLTCWKMPCLADPEPGLAVAYWTGRMKQRRGPWRFSLQHVGLAACCPSGWKLSTRD